MSNTLRDSLGSALWSAALEKATSEDRSVADVARELVQAWLRETPEDAEQRDHAARAEAEAAALRARVADCRQLIDEWHAHGEKLRTQLRAL